MEKKVDTSFENSKALGTSSWGEKDGPRGQTGFRDAKLFMGKDRATLTFFLDEEVASIHYDMIRNEVFYRGHNVKNMTMDTQLWLVLERFGDFLADHPHAGPLRKAYGTCLEHLRQDYGLPA